MTIEELEKKLTELDDLRLELREQIKELKLAMVEKEKPTPPHPRWKPSNADTYYAIGTCGDVFIQDWTDINNEIDKSRLSFGNVFKTRSEAEFAYERLKVLAEMQEWAGNWDDEFTLRYDKDSGIEAYLHAFPLKSYGEMRFATKLDAENCIKAVGEDRIIKYYFMIPEDKSNA